MKRYIKFGLIGAVVVGLAVAAYVYFFMYNKPHRDIESEEPAYTMTASEIYDDYVADEDAANKKYLDQVVQITGTIDRSEEDEKGNPVFYIKADNYEDLLGLGIGGGVLATVHERHKDKAGDYESGEEVTVKCLCTGFLEDVGLTNCFFID